MMQGRRRRSFGRQGFSNFLLAKTWGKAGCFAAETIGFIDSQVCTSWGTLAGSDVLVLRGTVRGVYSGLAVLSVALTFLLELFAVSVSHGGLPCRQK